MGVRPGYKQTEVGEIPENWRVERIHDVCTLINGRGFKPHEWQTTGLPIIRIQNLNGSEEFNYYSGNFNPKILVEHDQLLFAWSGSRGTSFGPHIWSGGQALLNYHTWKMAVNDSKVNQRFFLYALRQLTSHIEDTAHGASALVHTQKGEMEQFVLPIPPLPEQRAIAEALGDVDGLLGALDAVIAKKRDLKQAAMQQLLTAQTRLPGFDKEWQMKRLGDVFRISVGTSKSAFIIEGGDFWICDMGSVSSTGRLVVSKRTNYRGDFLAAGDLIMPKDDIGGGNIIGKVGYIDANDTYVLSDHVYHLRAEKGSPRFLAYAINSYRTNRDLRKKVIGSAQLGIGRKSVTEQEIQFPPIDEQIAIATVLSDIDIELTALEARRAKTAALKQGMMQELLTGRTRLV